MWGNVSAGKIASGKIPRDKYPSPVEGAARRLVWLEHSELIEDQWEMWSWWDWARGVGEARRKFMCASQAVLRPLAFLPGEEGSEPCDLPWVLLGSVWQL